MGFLGKLKIHESRAYKPTIKSEAGVRFSLASVPLSHHYTPHNCKYEVVLEQRQHHAALVKRRGMTHKLTGREVYDAPLEQRQGHSGEYNGNPLL